MVVPKINSAHGSDTRNVINRAIDVLNQQGESIQDLVAEGQLTPSQYAELITVINGLIKSGDVDRMDLNPNLRTEVDKIQNKIDEGEVSVNDINKNKGKLDQTFMSGEFLQQMAGNTPINSTPADFSLTNEKFAEKSVASRNTDFINHSNNLYNKSDIVTGARIDTLTGELDKTTGDFSVSSFIPIYPDTVYTGNNIARKGFYDENFTFISSTALDGTFTTPSNAFYARIQVGIGLQSTTQLNLGSVLLPYQEYKRKLDEDVEVTLKPMSIQDIHLGEKAVMPENTTFVIPSTNLFNKKSITEGKLIGEDGTVTDHVDYVHSDFFPVSGGTSYALSPFSTIAYYDINKVFIRRRVGSSNDLVITTDADARYAILNLNLNSPSINLDETQMNLGDTLLPYEEFGYKFDSSIMNVSGAENGEDSEESVRLKDAFVVNGKLDGYYHQSTQLPARELLGYQSIYDFYDSMVTDFPNYVSKTQIGSSVNDVPIYRYDFKPTDVEVSEDVTIPKMLVISGTHGTEKQAVETARHTMNQITRRWKEDDHLDTLRWNVHFIVVPILNPDGWGVPERKNANLIDINRQFPAGWRESDPSSNSYGGTAPLTEPESIALKSVFDTEDNLVYVCDFHNFSTRQDPENYYQFIWNAAGTVFNMNLARSLLINVSKEWKKKMDFVPQDDTTYFGYTSWTPGGSIAAYGASLGIQSSTFEVSQGFPYGEDGGSYTSTTTTLSVEAFINWLILNLRNNIRL